MNAKEESLLPRVLEQNCDKEEVENSTFLLEMDSAGLSRE
jgi:hypothetical protein